MYRFQAPDCSHRVCTRVGCVCCMLRLRFAFDAVCVRSVCICVCTTVRNPHVCRRRRRRSNRGDKTCTTQ